MTEQRVTQWYVDYSDSIYEYVFFLVHNAELAEDITQETFYKAFKSASSYRAQSSIKTWLYRIARNVAYDELRRKKLVAFITFQPQHEPVLQDIAWQRYIENEEQHYLYSSLAQLKLQYRDVLTLRYVYELSVKEVATILQFSESKVKSTTARALKALQLKLKESDWYAE